MPSQDDLRRIEARARRERAEASREAMHFVGRQIAKLFRSQPTGLPKNVAKG